MLIVKGVDRKDIKLIKQFTNYCLSRFLTPSQIRRLVINIEYRTRDEIKDPTDKQDLSKYEAWMVPSLDSRRHFTITLSKHTINKTAKCLLGRYKKSLEYLAHELVHVKQYYTGQMTDIYRDSDIIGTTWMGKTYLKPSPTVRASNPIKAEWAYYDSPWEIEAYGRSEGLYNMFHDECGDPWLEPS